MEKKTCRCLKSDFWLFNGLHSKPKPNQHLFLYVCVSGAVASTEVKQKLQEFLLSKSATKDTPTNGKNHSVSRHPKLWYTYVQYLAVFNSGVKNIGCIFSPPGHRSGLTSSELCGCGQGKVLDFSNIQCPAP